MNSFSGIIAELKLKHDQETEHTDLKLKSARSWRNKLAIGLVVSLFALLVLIVIVCIASNRSSTRQIRINNLESKVANMTGSQSELQAQYDIIKGQYDSVKKQYDHLLANSTLAANSTIAANSTTGVI